MLTALHTALAPRLAPAAREWLDRALAEPAALERHFTAAARACGSGCATEVRVLLLATHRPELAVLTDLHDHGTAAERHAVLTALPYLDPGPAALPLVHAALRTHDPRLIAAALGPYGAAELGAHDWRQAVLKCLFTGIPLEVVHDLPRRAAGDGELARMLRDFAAERTAAGRPVPADLEDALRLTARPAPADPAPAPPPVSPPVPPPGAAEPSDPSRPQEA